MIFENPPEIKNEIILAITDSIRLCTGGWTSTIRKGNEKHKDWKSRNETFKLIMQQVCTCICVYVYGKSLQINSNNKWI